MEWMAENLFPCYVIFHITSELPAAGNPIFICETRLPGDRLSATTKNFFVSVFH